MKIGVISDTHHRESVYSLPAPIKAVFVEVDLIIHAGDISHPSVIKELETIAPVMAVRGNKKEDKDNFKETLPKDIIFSKKGVTFAVVHCPTNRLKKEILHGLSLLGLQNLSDHLLVQELFSYFKNHGQIDCIIFGDTHKPFCKKINNIFLLNAGAAYPTSKRPGSVLIIDLDKKNQIVAKFIYFFS